LALGFAVVGADASPSWSPSFPREPGEYWLWANRTDLAWKPQVVLVIVRDAEAADARLKEAGDDWFYEWEPTRRVWTRGGMPDSVFLFGPRVTPPEAPRA
jgi:hypothetical protein